MKKLPQTSYILVGRGLAPVLTAQQKATLAQDLSQTPIPWEELLAEANRQQCTPLWYVQLKKHGLLYLLPEELQEYLAQITAANRIRNRKLKNELAEIVRLLAANDIAVLLLKGAATFVDGLYTDEGARLMTDLDLLIFEDQVQQAQNLLVAEGYLEDPDDARQFDTFPLKARHGHLASLLHADKGMLVELHYKVAYGQTGRIINVANAWETSISGEIKGQPVRILSPTLRVLHNALHATLPHQEFLRGSIGLNDLAEFAALWRRYPDAIDRARLLDIIYRHQLKTEFKTYARLSRLLMQTGSTFAEDIRTAVHARRILMNGTNENPAGISALAIKAIEKAYFFSRLPQWTWQNVVYGDEGTSNWKRIRSLVDGSFNARFRENIRF